MDNKNIFAANLRRLMTESNKTRKEVSAALGVSYYTFTDWVNGKKYPRMDKVEMLAQYFGVLKSDLIEDKEKSPSQSDGLTENQKLLIDFVRSVPDEKAALILRTMKAILEDD